MTGIKERPILFSAPMVRAILDGRKTVTRRALNAKALKNIGYGVQLGECHELPSEGPLHANSIGYYTDFCPFGQIGDRLWVRETWYCDHFEVQKGPYLRPADMHDLDQSREDGELVYAADGMAPYEQEQPIWKPSIHMPRWVSRILLEITDVRVERLQEISEEQAKAEGVRLYTDHAELGDWWHVEGIETYSADPRKSFELLWNSVGGDWNANPWVWVVEFKRVTP
ncbi:hypothetical protein F0170_07115 [Pseudomonas sp. MAFF 730085]|uniref:Morphogenetic protein n=1 Tax=Pseudomonas kitaguniensis TaxID=2607908 RepID=A0A5N7JQU9_9PSED|nr:hypothetical protein [Pseudomonas kitaguniensis]MPQ83770.1 hypothetical protein [Pseudomonas kitaguniensis]